MAAIDHLLFGASDLAGACDAMRRLLGAEAAPGGAHPGLGTHNALLGLGDTYLELIAPDPAQAPHQGLAAELAELDAPRLHGFAVRSDDLEGIARRLAAAGAGARVIEMSRAHPDGRRLAWRIALPTDHAFGRYLPFAIDWGDSPNPSSELAAVGRLTALRLAHPDTGGLQRLVDALGLDLRVEDAATPALRATVETKGGPAELTS